MLKTHTYKLSMYPKDITLREGTSVTLRPMASADGDALLDFFQRIPADDRYYLKEDVLDPSVIKRWMAELDFDRTLPIVALAGGKIIADGTLHRTRAMARRHVGSLRILVDPAYRMKGLGTMLLHELAAIADANVLDRLLLEAVAVKEEAAIRAAEFVGFVRVATFPGHVKDADGHPWDVVLLEMPMGKWFAWWSY
ncbi:MAG: putative GCN5-related N-acetyltransferase [Dehalococcoidia bacterium]|nr:putative GCN5-related N-acetyltransferase [Dehalococcoidia bacterium]